MALTTDRTGRRSETLNRYNRLAWTSRHAARHGRAREDRRDKKQISRRPPSLPPRPEVTGGRPLMPGGLTACFGVRPQDVLAEGGTVYTP